MDLSFITTAFAAVEKGAATIYHDVLATGAAVTSWEASNPVVGELIDSGVTYAEDMLKRFGVPVGTISLVGSDIVAGLKQLAALDATVPSVSTVTTTVASVVSAVDPAVASVATLAGEVVGSLAAPLPPAAA